MTLSSRVWVGRGVEQRGACHDVWCRFALTPRLLKARAASRIRDPVIGHVGVNATSNSPPRDIQGIMRAEYCNENNKYDPGKVRASTSTKNNNKRYNVKKPRKKEHGQEQQYERE